LNERYRGVQLPAITIIDTKKIISKDKNKIIISPDLQNAIEQSIEEDKQVILFQNRRGYSPYQVCQACGWIPQ
jgi:primosomal protein N' (replication factor Y)